MKKTLKLSSACLAFAVGIMSVTTVSCGESGNVFEKAHKETTKEKAQKLMAKEDYDGAIVLLEAYLVDEPGDSEAISALVYARSKRSKSDLSRILASAGGGTSGSAWEEFAKVMPEGTQENVNELLSSVALLNSIPNRTSEQNVQLAAANLTLAVTQAKMVATDANGTFDKTKADSELTDESATVIINAITGADSALAASGSDQTNSGKLSGVSSDLNTSSGDTPSEKLKNYLQKK